MIFELIVNYRIDAVAFGVLLVLMAISVHTRLRRRHRRGVSRASWWVLSVLLITAAGAPEFAGQRERARLRDMLSGIAPTYAQELELMGHGGVTLETAPDDPLYLAMIEAQIRWERINHNVSDIYTFAKRADGKVVLMVDAETDYDGDGAYRGEDEQRTRIGEEYDEMTVGMLRALDGRANFDDVPVRDRWGNWVSAYEPMRDVNGNVGAVLGVDYDAGQWLGSIAWNRAAALGLVSILAVIWLSWSMVVAVTRAELTKRIAAERERERMHEQLLTASRQAGMAEVATGVLHNVGNVLNSVNVSAGVVAEKLRASKVASLAKATQMLLANSENLGGFLTEDPKGKLLPQYLSGVADVLAGERETMLKELTSLGDNIDHIKQIVAAQQNFARQTVNNETFRIESVFEDAIRINAASLERHRIKMLRDVADCDPVTTDRHKILQILVNLISNAKNAVRSKSDGDKQITLSLKQALNGDRRAVARIEVTDSGMGISKENLTEIFKHGFTTRRDGHGFGLHTAAIAAQQMRGSLTAASDGPGKGATFTLSIPVGEPVTASFRLGTGAISRDRAMNQ